MNEQFDFSRPTPRPASPFNKESMDPRLTSYGPRSDDRFYQPKHNSPIVPLEHITGEKQLNLDSAYGLREAYEARKCRIQGLGSSLVPMGPGEMTGQQSYSFDQGETWIPAPDPEAEVEPYVTAELSAEEIAKLNWKGAQEAHANEQLRNRTIIAGILIILAWKFWG